MFEPSPTEVLTSQSCFECCAKREEIGRLTTENEALLGRLKALERLYRAAGICKGQLDPSEYGEEEVKEFEEALAACEKFSRNESSWNYPNK